VALSGIVGSGKTTTLRRIQETLIQEKEILVAKSLAIEKSKINLSTPDDGPVLRPRHREGRSHADPAGAA
jgi:Ni2+-binding GTPase involved in maturation of urease and hydrogenase